jgi:hypothetical protein
VEYVPGASPFWFTVNTAVTGEVPTITKEGDVNQFGKGIVLSNKTIAPGLEAPRVILCDAGKLPFWTALKIRFAVTGDTVNVTSHLRVLLVDTTSTVPVYVPKDKLRGFTEIVTVDGVTALVNDAESHDWPLVEIVNCEGANWVVIDHCCAGGTLPPCV